MMNAPSQTETQANERTKHEQSLWDAIIILHGDGVDKYLRIASVETGVEAWVEVGQINPLTMRLAKS
jgi:hypothetical protein